MKKKISNFLALTALLVLVGAVICKAYTVGRDRCLEYNDTVADYRKCMNF